MGESLDERMDHLAVVLRYLGRYEEADALTNVARLCRKLKITTLEEFDGYVRGIAQKA